ncbi:MAG: hypothetical protein DMF61_24780 [Blastocatellia bacterium AA13]|nr:MAG: hypothetical protein DMF61_24780 [Blastocatellia bacterium AA13]
MNHQTGSSSIADTPDQHGFVMCGLETLFLCHLPMFYMENHRYQLILQVSIPEYAMAHYAADRRKNPGTPYILGNVQTDLMTIPQMQNRQEVSFVSDIFRGLPNDPNKDKPLIHNVNVTINRIVHYRYFDFNMDYPTSLTYILFGAGTEAHLTHYITKQPDFDQVLDLAESPDWLDIQHLQASVPINIPSLASQVYCSNPLVNPEYDVQLGGSGSYRIKIGRSYFFDTASLNNPDPCQGA